MQKGQLFVQTTCFQDNDAIRRNNVFCRRHEKEASCRKGAINHQNLQACYNYLCAKNELSVPKMHKTWTICTKNANYLYKKGNCLYNLYKKMNYITIYLYKQCLLSVKKLIVCTICRKDKLSVQQMITICTKKWLAWLYNLYKKRKTVPKKGIRSADRYWDIPNMRVKQQRSEGPHAKHMQLLRWSVSWSRSELSMQEGCHNSTHFRTW
jgi:hypothetical protein